MVNTEGQDLFLDEIYGYMEFQEGEMVYRNEYNEEELLPSYLLEYPKGFDKLSKKKKDLIEKLFLYGDNNDIPKYIINITEKDKLYKQDWNDIEYFLNKRKIMN